MTTCGYTLLEHAGAAADADPCPCRAPRNSAASIRRRCRSMPAWPRSPRRRTALQPVPVARLGRLDQGRPRRLSRHGRRRPQVAGPAADGRDRDLAASSACPPTPSSPTAPATTPPGCIASTATGSFRTQLAPTNGSMGYGVPAAVAAKAVHPHADRLVVFVNGDGCFMMNGQELATAVQYDLRRHLRRRQQRHVRHHPHAPGARRIPAASPAPIWSIRISSRWPAPMAPMASWWRRPPTSPPPSSARPRAGKPALIEIKLDPEAISPRMSLSQIRERALAKA